MDCPVVNEGLVTMPREDFEELLSVSAERGARRALSEVGLDGDSAANDVRDLRDLISSWRSAKSEAGKVVVKWITTILLAALLAGMAVKLKLGLA